MLEDESPKVRFLLKAGLVSLIKQCKFQMATFWNGAHYNLLNEVVEATDKGWIGK